MLLSFTVYSQVVVIPPASSINDNHECTVDYDGGISYEEMKVLADCDEEIPGKFAIALHLAITRRTDGSGNFVDEAYLRNLWKHFDESFGEHGIYFVLKCIEYIDSDEVYELGTQSPIIEQSVENDPNAITLFLLNNYVEGGMSGIGGGTPQAGIGVLTPSGERYPRSIIHELGHTLGLFHLYEGAGGPDEEFIDGSNCCTAGDLICDTPADPDFCSQEFNCGWENPQALTDSQGDLYTDVLGDNFMTTCGQNGSCLEMTFTAGQGARMRQVINEGFFFMNTQRPDALITEFTIQSDESAAIAFDTDVRVLEGGYLWFLNSTVEMAPGRKIQVDPGGRLRGLETVFTVGDFSCGQDEPFWEGIVLENAEENLNDPSYHAAVVLVKGAVEYAERGIAYGRNDVNVAKTGLAIVHDVTFTNNKVSLNFVNGQPVSSPLNISHHWVQSCDFIIDGDYPDDGSGYPKGTAVKLAYSNPFDCFGCHFELPSFPGVKEVQVQAINAIGTKINIAGYCEYDDTECETTSINNSSFVNYPVGISMQFGGNSTISETVFEGCPRSIIADFSPGLTVEKNIFHPDNTTEAFGTVNLNVCSGFIIDKNVFENLLGNTKRTALKIKDSGGGTAFVMNNSFTNFSRSIVHFQGVNAPVNDPFSGVFVECNQFDNPASFFTSLGPYDVRIDGGATIAAFQGSGFDPAGNVFSNSSHSGSDIFNGEPGIINDDITYYYSVVGGPLENPSNAIGVQDVPVNVISVCATQLPGGFVGDGGVPNVEAYQADVFAHEDDYASETDPIVRRSLEASILNLKQDLFFYLADWATTIEEDTTIIDKNFEFAKIDVYRAHSGKFYEADRVLKSGASVGFNDLAFALESEFGHSLGGNVVTGIHKDPAVANGNKFIVSESVRSTLMASRSDDQEIPTLKLYSAKFLELYYDEYDVPNTTKSLSSFSSEEITLTSSVTSSKTALVYPNPVVGSLVNVERIVPGSTVKIIDSNGRLVFSNVATTEKMEVRMPVDAKGIYFCSVINNTGEVEIFKLIVL